MVGENSGWLVVAGLIGAFITGLFGWLVQRSKGKVEETVAVRGEWAKLTDGLSQRLANVEKEFAAFRISSAQEMAEMKKAHAAEIAEIKLNHAAEMKAMRDLNEGLQRMISQVSHSTVMRLGDPAGSAMTQAARKDRGEE